MKRNLSLFLLSLLLLFSVVGCASPKPNATPNNQPQSTESSQNQTSSTEPKITKEDAKSIALKNAGVTDNEIYDYDIDLDLENGILVYEISFEKDATEYEYHINASDGTILKSHNEPDF